MKAPTLTLPDEGPGFLLDGGGESPHGLEVAGGVDVGPQVDEVLLPAPRRQPQQLLHPVHYATHRGAQQVTCRRTTVHQSTDTSSPVGGRQYSNKLTPPHLSEDGNTALNRHIFTCRRFDSAAIN